MRQFVGVMSVVLCAAGFATAEEPKAKAFDVEKLVGEWKYVSGVKNGEEVPKDHLMGVVTFTKDKITVPAGPDSNFLMAFQIDGKTTPAKIDMEIKDGPVKEGKAIGLVAIDGDKLRIIYAVAEDEKTKRPADFKSTKDNGAFYFELTRVKK